MRATASCRFLDRGGRDGHSHDATRVPFTVGHDGRDGRDGGLVDGCHGRVFGVW